MKSKIADILRKARRQIDTPEKWTRRMFGIDDGPYCAVGAIGRVIPPYRLSYFDSTALGVSAVEALYDALPPDAKERRTCEGNWTAVSVWQDEDERTHTEVLALFDRAIAALE